MQYDENAEKYGYEGEMTPMKCEELKSVYIDRMGDWCRSGNNTGTFYLKEEADAVIAELKDIIADLQKTNVTLADNAVKLNKKLESMYADVVDANMENRRLKRALWIARAEWARSSALSYHLIESHPNKDVAATYKRKANKWEKVKDKCLAKAEEYK